MRYVWGFAFFVLCVPASAQEPTQRELLAAIEKQLKTTAATAGPSIACVVVSRSEHYPKPPSSGDMPGKLGGFDRKEFLKNNASAERLPWQTRSTCPTRGRSRITATPAESSSIRRARSHAVPRHRRGDEGLRLPSGRCRILRRHPRRRRAQRPRGIETDRPAQEAHADQVRRRADARHRREEGDRVYRQARGADGEPILVQLSTRQAERRVSGSITNVRYRLINPKGADAALEKQASYYRHGPLLEHDIKLNAGMTGAALLNLDGELIGLATTAAVVYSNREIGPGYAIPADDNFRRIVEVLRKGEEVEYGFLGVTLPDDRIGVIDRAGHSTGTGRHCRARAAAT